MRKGQRPGLRKEKIIMLSASLFVLSALTMTGVYVKEKNKSDNDGYVVDLSAIEKQVGDKAEEIEKANELAMLSDDLDSDPNYQEANSGKVENTAEDMIQIPGVGYVKVQNNKTKDTDAEMAEEVKDNGDENIEEAGEVTETTAKAASDSVVAYRFEDEGTLQWPIVGNVLINYSMDKTVYFASLEQYKYNPAIVIAATVGEPITAAADGEVTSVYNNEEIGGAVAMNLGDGYELVYGQLENMQVGVGDNIKTGDIIGYVANPTKYYSVEGSNMYFKLTKDGVATNPLNRLQ